MRRLTIRFAARLAGLFVALAAPWAAHAGNILCVAQDGLVQADQPLAEQRRSDTLKAAIIRLHGTVGGLVHGSAQGTFDAELLRQCFRHAEREGAALVILDINSNGGDLPPFSVPVAMRV